MGDFTRCIAVILAEEGGLANHRRDPGGLVWLLTAPGLALSPEQQTAIVGAGAALTGLIGAFFTDPSQE